MEYVFPNSGEIGKGRWFTSVNLQDRIKRREKFWNKWQKEDKLVEFQNFGEGIVKILGLTTKATIYYLHGYFQKVS